MIYSILPFLLFATSVTNALRFHCEFFYVGHYTLGRVYSCGETIVTFDGFDYLTGVYGNHLESKVDIDVEYLLISSTNLTKIPKGMETFFPALRGINLVTVQIEEISAADFEPFPNLQALDLAANKIVSLVDDLFKFTPNLIDARFSSNQLRHIGLNTFRNLDSLSRLSLDRNPCIDVNMYFHDREALLTLLDQLPAACPPLEELPTDPPIQCPADCSHRISANEENINCLVSRQEEQHKIIDALSERLTEVERKLEELSTLQA